MLAPSRDFSQYGEQAHILGYLGDQVGRFPDIGAYEGVTFSNTRALAELGWEGVLVEPDPHAFVGLLKNCGNQPKLKLVHAALAPAAGLREFFTSGGDALSSFDAAHCEKWRAGYGSQFTPVYVQAITPDQLLAALPGPYAFVNLDVEGGNWDLLQQLPLQAMGTRLICVEYDNKLEAMKTWLAQQGYRQVLHFNGTNLIVGR